jgi:hypothetical protein
MADRGKLSLNLLEYLASITTIAMEAAAGNIQPDACILSQLDSSTADYWLQPSRRSQVPGTRKIDPPRHLTMARRHTGHNTSL